MSSVETGQMSAVETGQMSAAETAQMSSAETRQMSTGQTGRCPVSAEDICLVSAEDICPVSAADICPVSTADICPVSTEDIWLLWGHLGKVGNDFDPFFTPKMRKMEHRSWSRRSHGNDATGRSAEPHSLAKALVGSQKPLWRLYLGELMLWFILGRSKMISTLFYTKNTQNGTQPVEPALPAEPVE